MSRFPSGQMSYTFGPGPMTPAVRAIVYANVAAFVVTLLAPAAVTNLLGLSPQAVLTQGFVWQLGTYLFIHADVFHILWNMLAVWMFGVDLERRWGTEAFARYYGVVGIGSGICVVLVSLLPLASTQGSYYALTIGASGAVYGLLMAWAIIFPHRTVLFFGIFPLKARVFVLLLGAITFLQASGAGGPGVSHLAHLGGLAAGWWYLKTPTRPRPRPQPPRPTHLRRVH